MTSRKHIRRSACYRATLSMLHFFFLSEHWIVHSVDLHGKENKIFKVLTYELACKSNSFYQKYCRSNYFHYAYEKCCSSKLHIAWSILKIFRSHDKKVPQHIVLSPSKISYNLFWHVLA